MNKHKGDDSPQSLDCLLFCLPSYQCRLLRPLSELNRSTATFPTASSSTCHVIYSLLLSFVPEPPRSLYLAVDGRRLDPGNLFLPVKEGAELAVSCVVEGGHPPASLVWLLTPHHSPGLNTSGGTHPHISEAHLGNVLRAYHNSTVTCLAKHQALTHPLNQSLQLHVQCK